MKSKLLVLTVLLVLILNLLTACAKTSEGFSATPMAATETESNVQGSGDLNPADSITIYAPMSTSSIPVLLAAKDFSNVQVVLYTDQSQANTEFIRGDVSLLVSGLSVGVDMHKNGVPVQVVNSFVSGLSYLVTYGKPISSLNDLSGKSVYIPFEGSPIDEVMKYLVTSAGLTWKSDVTPVYSPFDSSIELLKQGKAEAVVLPEPSVTLVEGQPNVFISLDLAEEWNHQTGMSSGYPQVATFVNPDWAAKNGDFLNEFNNALQKAIQSVQKDPESAIKQVQDHYKLTPDKLLKSVSRTRYLLSTGTEMKTTIENYYQTIGSPINENFSDFYFGTAH
jgi:NitT/TauT family transport system substrate-binding protein